MPFTELVSIEHLFLIYHLGNLSVIHGNFWKILDCMLFWYLCETDLRKQNIIAYGSFLLLHEFNSI